MLTLPIILANFVAPSSLTGPIQHRDPCPPTDASISMPSLNLQFAAEAAREHGAFFFPDPPYRLLKEAMEEMKRPEYKHLKMVQLLDQMLPCYDLADNAREVVRRLNRRLNRDQPPDRVIGQREATKVVYGTIILRLMETIKTGGVQSSPPAPHGSSSPAAPPPPQATSSSAAPTLPQAASFSSSTPLAAQGASSSAAPAHPSSSSSAAAAADHDSNGGEASDDSDDDYEPSSDDDDDGSTASASGSEGSASPPPALPTEVDLVGYYNRFPALTG